MREAAKVHSELRRVFRMLNRRGQVIKMHEAFKRLHGRKPDLNELARFATDHAGEASLHLWQQLEIGIAVLEADQQTKH